MQPELVESRWPMDSHDVRQARNAARWRCGSPTWCARSAPCAARDQVPGSLHKGLEGALATGNNLRLPKEDFLFILEDVAGEIREEPGFADLQVQVDKKGARVLTTIHNKLVNTHTEDLKHWWKTSTPRARTGPSVPKTGKAPAGPIPRATTRP